MLPRLVSTWKTQVIQQLENTWDYIAKPCLNKQTKITQTISVPNISDKGNYTCIVIPQHTRCSLLPSLGRTHIKYLTVVTKKKKDVYLLKGFGLEGMMIMHWFAKTYSLQIPEAFPTRSKPTLAKLAEGWIPWNQDC